MYAVISKLLNIVLVLKNEWILPILVFATNTTKLYSTIIDKWSKDEVSVWQIDFQSNDIDLTNVDKQSKAI